MTRLLNKALAAAGCALVGVVGAQASELVYSPKNPAFGGNPFMADYLLSTATAQRQFDAPSRTVDSDPFADFQATLERRLLSELSRDITEAIFGESAQESGFFSVGETEIEFETIDGEVVITITDGDQTTTVTLPLIAP